MTLLRTIDLRERLLAGLLADPSGLLLVRHEPAVSVLVEPAEPRRMDLVALAPSLSAAIVHELLDAHARSLQEGSPATCLVAVGVGPHVIERMRDLPPLAAAVSLSVYALDAGLELALLSGKKDAALERVVPGLADAPPMSEEAIAAAIAHAKAELSRERAAEAGLVGRRAVTSTLIGACLSAFAVSYAWGTGVHGLVLQRLGANTSASLHGEPWRLLASAFLHGDPLHVGVNMLALWSLGPLLEAALGPRRHLLLYGLTALSGAVASSLLGGEGRSSVGASGAIWGLMGAVAGLAVRPAGVLPPILAKRMRSRIAAPVILNVLYSLVPGVDLLAHAGGGLLGFLLGATVLQRGLVPVDRRRAPEHVEDAPRPWLSAAALLVTLAMAASMAAAVIVGRPWVVASPSLQRVRTSDGAVSVEVPAAVVRPATATVAGETRTYVFGDLSESPVVFEITAAPAPPGDPEDALASAQAQLDAEAPPGSPAASAARRVSLAGRDAVRAERRTRGLDVVVLFLVVDSRQVMVRGYARARGDSRPASWVGVEERVAASLRVAP